MNFVYAKGENGFHLRILEENHYYPFGLKHENYNTERRKMAWDIKLEGGEEIDFKKLQQVPNSGYQYKYNGKEWQDELGLNVYDMEARNYMPDIGRWGVIDELAEEFYEWSPYNFSFNSPISFSDPSGMAPESSNYIASTVVNKKGEILDYKDDGDDNIYLNERGGEVVGKEREGVKYEVGKKIVQDDLINYYILFSDGIVNVEKTVKKTIEARNGYFEVSPLLGGLYRGGLNFIVYLSRGSNGVSYVGITSQFAIRQATHLRNKGIKIEKLLENLSKSDAKAVEQVLIEMYKLGGKEGQTGQLLNKINSIAKSNPAYNESISRGIELLRGIGL